VHVFESKKWETKQFTSGTMEVIYGLYLYDTTSVQWELEKLMPLRYSLSIQFGQK